MAFTFARGIYFPLLRRDHGLNHWLNGLKTGGPTASVNLDLPSEFM